MTRTAQSIIADTNVIDLTAIFRAGFVRRWHTNPDLAHTCDRIDGHSARVARIILALHPDPTIDLIEGALIHDDGESVVGDVKAPTKDADPSFADFLHDAEERAIDAIWPRRSTILADERDWLRFSDRLDAYMWAAHHAPHTLTGDGWPEARQWLLNTASKLNCRDAVSAALGRDPYTINHDRAQVAAYGSKEDR